MRDAAVLFVLSVLATAISARASANTMVVNRDTGRIVWLNAIGERLDVAAYTLQSPSGGFRPGQWLPISEHYDADSGGSFDPDDIWIVLGSSTTDLSEGTTTSGSASLAEGTFLWLGNAWTPGSVEDALFEYLDTGLDEVVAGELMYVSDVDGDYNGNGLVEQGDLDLVLTHWGGSATSIPPGWFHDFPSGIVDQDELDRVLVNWGVPGRSVPLPESLPILSAAVPEPAGFMLVLIALLGGRVLFARRNGRTRQLRPRVIGSGRGRPQIRQCLSTSAAVPM